MTTNATYDVKAQIMAHCQINMTGMTPYEKGEYIALGPGPVSHLIEIAAFVAAALGLQGDDNEKFAEGFMAGREYMRPTGAASAMHEKNEQLLRAALA